MKKHKTFKFILMITGLVILPVYSILFGINGNLIEMTFSQVGGRLDGKLEGLIIWGLICALYFYSGVKYMQLMSGKSNNYVDVFLVLGCISLILTVILPFNTMMYPIASQIHNNLARIAIVFIVVSIIIFVVSFYNYDKKIFTISLSIFAVVVMILLFVFFKYRISSIFQIVFSTIISYYLMFVFILIEKSSKVDYDKINITLEEKNKLFNNLEENELNIVFDKN